MPGMYVTQFELAEAEPDGALAPKRVPPGTLASIDTHDTPTFAGWWTGRDAEIRAELGQMEAGDAEEERAGRADLRRKLAAGLGVRGSQDPAAVAEAVHRRLLAMLGRSRAGLVLATMEDLWLETEPQNTPGSARAENWRRQAQRPIDALAEPDIAEQLDELNESREGSDD